jgi:3'(2'), 5'-bisphosphate nucleotidase
LDLIDSSSSSNTSASSKNGRYWTIDPIDGTKGYLRKQQYAVCLALLEDNEVSVGVLGCPNLPFPEIQKSLVSPNLGTLMWASKNNGAFQVRMLSLS